MIIIKPSKRCVDHKYFLDYDWKDEPGSGFSFPCDKHGNLIMDEMTEASLENYEKCRSGEYDVVFKGIVKYTNRYIEPAVGLCDCGDEVTLRGFTNTCSKCGADYNVFGQKLAPRSQWGEETGESLSDILAIR